MRLNGRHGLVLAACCIALLGLLHVLRFNADLTAGNLGIGGGSSAVPQKTTRVRGPEELVHVCLSSNDPDLRPAAAAIQSAFASCAEPDRLVFHYVTTEAFAPTAQSLLQEHVPGINLKVHSSQALDDRLKSLITWRKSSKSRRVLSSPFNFAPFYLDKYIAASNADGSSPAEIKRLIYIDTDVLILGDLLELQTLDMQGHSCAAVPYCLQRMEDYINFDVLASLGFREVYDRKACIVNRGLLVIDVAKWNAKGMTEDIEAWMGRYASSEKDLWVGGMSQPPWLLAMNGDFLPLKEEWNCNSLGRESMSMWESIVLRRSGFDHLALRQLDVKFSAYGSVSPHIVTCSSEAKMLHYNGDMKPWVADRLRRTAPRCALPEVMPQHAWKWSRTVRVFCDDVTFVQCQELWSVFISPRAVLALRDIDAEWAEEERRWKEQIQEEKSAALKKKKKIDQERKEKQEKEEKEREKEREKEEKEKQEKEKQEGERELEKQKASKELKDKETKGSKEGKDSKSKKGKDKSKKP